MVPLPLRTVTDFSAEHGDVCMTVTLWLLGWHTLGLLGFSWTLTVTRCYLCTQCTCYDVPPLPSVMPRYTGLTGCLTRGSHQDPKPRTGKRNYGPLAFEHVVEMLVLHRRMEGAVRWQCRLVSDILTVGCYNISSPSDLSLVKVLVSQNLLVMPCRYWPQVDKVQSLACRVLPSGFGSARVRLVDDILCRPVTVRWRWGGRRLDWKDSTGASASSANSPK